MSIESANLPLAVVLPLVVATAMTMAFGLLCIADASFRRSPYILALLCGLVSIVVDNRIASVSLAVGWLLATAAIAVRGALRIVGFGLRPLHELAQSFAMVYLSVGGM